MKRSGHSDVTNVVTGNRAQTPGTIVAARDLLMVIGLTTLVLGVASLHLGRAETSSVATVPRAVMIVAPIPPVGIAPVRVHASSQGVRRDPGTPPFAAAWRPSGGQSTEAGAARTYLLEMSARLRRTTLGADRATRDAVSLDVEYAYQWLG